MIHRTSGWLPAIVALFAIACQAQEPEQTGTTEEPATIDTETVRQSIEATNDRFEQALLAGDATALSALYTDDAIVQAPGHPAAEGIDGIGEFWSGMLSEGAPTSISLTTERVIVADSGDLAVEVGSYSIAGTGPDGTSWEDEGKYQVAWQNVDGEWKLVTDTWNSDAPPPGAEGPAAAEEAGTEAPATGETAP